MRERWLVDRAHDRLVVTAAMMQRLHDQLRFGLMASDRADVAAALVRAQIDQAIRLLEEASSGLRAGRESGHATPPGETEPVKATG